jgi:hypothetical protein
MGSEVATKQDLTQLVKESGLEQPKAQYLLDKFSSYFAIAADWETKASAIEVTSEDQVAEMKMAREGRPFLRSKRIEVEKARKTLKEQSLREGKAIDGIANILKAVIVPIEEYLDEQEHYVERKRAAEEEARRLEAEKLLREKEERERLEREVEERRIRAENERLRKEAEAKEAELRAEREAAAKAQREAEAKAKREREAVEAKYRAEREAERKAMEAERAKEREELEARMAEERRLAAMVTCPACGHTWERTE